METKNIGGQWWPNNGVVYCDWMMLWLIVTEWCCNRLQPNNVVGWWRPNKWGLKRMIRPGVVNKDWSYCWWLKWIDEVWFGPWTNEGAKIVWSGSRVEVENNCSDRWWQKWLSITKSADDACVRLIMPKEANTPWKMVKDDKWEWRLLELWPMVWRGVR